MEENKHKKGLKKSLKLKYLINYYELNRKDSNFENIFDKILEEYLEAISKEDLKALYHNFLFREDIYQDILKRAVKIYKENPAEETYYYKSSAFTENINFKDVFTLTKNILKTEKNEQKQSTSEETPQKLEPFFLTTGSISFKYKTSKTILNQISNEKLGYIWKSIIFYLIRSGYSIEAIEHDFAEMTIVQIIDTLKSDWKEILSLSDEEINKIFDPVDSFIEKTVENSLDTSDLKTQERLKENLDLPIKELNLKAFMEIPYATCICNWSEEFSKNLRKYILFQV